MEVGEFLLTRAPITQAQWRAVARWRPRDDEEPWPMDLDPDPVAKLSDPKRCLGDQRPVVNGSWDEAMAFCHRLSQRTGRACTLPRRHHHALPLRRHAHHGAGE